MSVNKEQLLVDHLDHLLQGDELDQIENLIRTDNETAEQWRYLNLAVEAIQYNSLFDQVADAKREWLSESHLDAIPRQAVVRSMYRVAIRIAACVLLFAGSLAVYKYATVSPSGIYNNYYSSFELNTSRGTANIDKMEQAYRNKNWAEVVTQFKASKEKDNKAYFLDAMAEMELKEFGPAISSLKQVIAANAQSGDNYFQEEAEYYLALSYLADNQTGLAIPILEKIKTDSKHIYNKKARAIPAIDLKFLEYKRLKN
ncbi:MAG TPA: hypothetical protein VGZ71_12650 [Puia sp.]|nr:hypothetical protein [Puia sp.]